MIVGRIINAKVICPASREKPNFRYKTKNAKPNSPKTIEGVPLSRSAPARIIFVTIPSFVYSCKKIAAPTPKGKEIAIAPATKYNVPMIEGNIPPDLPRLLGPVVRNSQLSAPTPLVTIYARMMPRKIMTMMIDKEIILNAIFCFIFIEIFFKE